MKNDGVTQLPMLWRGEVKVLEADFDGELAADETISSVEPDCTVVQGTDASPLTVLLGVAQVVGRKVLQRVQWQVPGVVYEVRLKATGNGGLKHVRVGRLTAE